MLTIAMEKPTLHEVEEAIKHLEQLHQLLQLNEMQEMLIKMKSNQFID